MRDQAWVTARGPGEATARLRHADQGPPAVASTGANPGTVGTAFDYRLRFDLGPVACAETVASHAPLLLAQAGQRDLVRLIGSFFERTDALAGRLRAHEVEVGDDDDLVTTRACVALALLESVYRAGYWAHLLPAPADLDDLVPDAVVTDVRALHRSAKAAFASFIGPIRAGMARYVANPTFAGSLAVGGADADLVEDDTLLELKTAKTLDGATLRTALLQLLGYALLDYDDHLGIRQVGVYFARQEYVRVWPLWRLVFPPGGRHRLGRRRCRAVRVGSCRTPRAAARRDAGCARRLRGRLLGRLGKLTTPTPGQPS